MKLLSLAILFSFCAQAEETSEIKGTPAADKKPMGAIVIQKGQTMIDTGQKASEDEDEAEQDEESCKGRHCRQGFGMWSHGNSHRGGMTFDFAYVDSRYDKLDPTLDRGSFRFGFNFSGDFRTWMRGYIGMRVLGALGGKLDDDHTHAIDFDLGAKFYPLECFARPFVSLGMVIGSYRAWSIGSDTATSITYTKHASGAYIGTNPGLGVQLQLSRHFSTDIKADYTLVLGKDAWKLHGLGIGLGMNLGF